MSGKRSLDGKAGRCPTTGLQNELSDDKIGGRNNGQKSNGTDRICAGIDG